MALNSNNTVEMHVANPTRRPERQPVVVAPALRPWAAPLACGLLAMVLVALQLDAGGAYPNLPQGPGLTTDESFNVQQGVYLAQALRHYHFLLIFPEIRHDVFESPAFLPDHPPLGRLWLGLHHELLTWVWPHQLGADIYVSQTAGRWGSATAFGLLVAILVAFGQAWFSPAGGVAAGLALCLMPRAWGHAHLASLETTTNLTGMLALLAVLHVWTRTNQPQPSIASALGCGVLTGLALLTKIQAVFLGPIVLLWGLWLHHTRAITWLVTWGITAWLTFLVGWPWLWASPVTRILKYLGRSTDRLTLHNYYGGQVWDDRLTPWHYPWIIFAITTPWLLLALGTWGANPRSTTATQRARIGGLLLAWALTLAIFSMPGVAVYDGERLFLMSAPVWAMLVGAGVARLWSWSAGRVALVVAAIASAFAGQFPARGPAWLMQYPGLPGGVAQAESLGYEIDYWGSSLTREFWQVAAKHIPIGETIMLAPTLHQFQLSDWTNEVTTIRQHHWTLIPWNPQAQPYWIIAWRRLADLPAELHDLALTDYETIAQIDAQTGLRSQAAAGPSVAAAVLLRRRN